ncbi:hypothetical protein [Halorubrum sp. N11]|uniref:hypothetical protein n=1 Tax=Halorubrum sp. N11 TaxID=3402276 RepID=UPI003EBDD189
MGLLSRLRAWLGELFGGADGDDLAGEAQSATAESAGEDDPDSDANDRLDPSAATETRTRATDDAVDALRDVRQNGSAPGVGAAESGDADAENTESVGTDAENTDPNK